MLSTPVTGLSSNPASLPSWRGLCHVSNMIGQREMAPTQGLGCLCFCSLAAAPWGPGVHIHRRGVSLGVTQKTVVTTWWMVSGELSTLGCVQVVGMGACLSIDLEWDLIMYFSS